MDRQYSIVWTEPEGISWFIRGIHPDGSFYGDIRYDSACPALRLGAVIEGVIPPEDWLKCRKLISKITELANPPSTALSAGVLGFWTDSLGNPTIIFRYNPGDETASECAQLFCDLKTTIESEVSKDYDRITQQGN